MGDWRDSNASHHLGARQSERKVEMLKRIFILAAVMAATLAVPTLASAAQPTTTTVVTHMFNHPDTTYDGSVWAYDNLSLRYTVTRVPDALGPLWLVHIDIQGSFVGFKNPTTGEPQANQGSVKGSIEYSVYSYNTPDKSAVPAQSDGASESIRTPIAQMFGKGASDPTQVGGYSFQYRLVDGSVYYQ
jgi:hypothetical protein